jgi:hypothetical protein
MGARGLGAGAGRWQHASIKMYTLLKRQVHVGDLWKKLSILTHEHEGLYATASDQFGLEYTDTHLMDSTLMDSTLQRVAVRALP